VIGWIFGAAGVLLGASDLAFQYADRALFITTTRPVGAATAAWVQNACLSPCFGLLGLALLLFPDGRVPSSRWRPALWLGVAAVGTNLFAGAVLAGPLVEPFETVRNPLGVAAFAGALNALNGFSFVAMLAGVGLAALATVLRLRRSRGLEREQLKWIAYAGAVTGGLMVLTFALYFAGFNADAGLAGAVVAVNFAIFPLAAGAAILRHRLYDIDVVINRTMVYGALTATLGTVYLSTVLVLQQALGWLTHDSGLAVAASTLGVAALFRPALTLIQSLVDRRFYRRRYDARRTLEAFAARLRDEIDLGALDSELSTVVQQTLQPAHVSLWLRDPDRGGGFRG
jgi:hypothetical protein